MREHEEVRQKERLLSKKNEVRRKKKKLNLFFLFFFFIANNSAFPGLTDDSDSLSTSATECDNTETGL